ncbi:MAG: NAD(P)-dependent oxidoreductase [Patescibacteria group bacterium]|jgi:nucleoside-diphosphate-sugar epimerase
MNILITGATGFIGSHLLKRLLAQKYRIIILKRTTSDLGRINDLIKEIRFYNVDQLVNLDKIFVENKIDIIIHLSAMYSKEDKGKKMESQMDKINIKIPKKLLETAIKYEVKGFINTGTFFEYSLKTNKPISEASKIDPYNYYTITKIQFEKILAESARNGKIKAVTLKLFSPYGENDNKKVIPLIIKSILTDQRLFLTKGNQKLAFTYVEDIVDAYILAIRYLNNQNLKYDFFNIGNNRSYSLKEAVSFIRDISKKNIKVEFGKINNNKDENLDVHCDTTKAKLKLKWEARTSLLSGLKKTYNSYKKTI